MVQVTDSQAETISPEAMNFLRANNPIQIPGDRLTQDFADALNREIQAQTEPLLEQLRPSFAYAWRPPPSAERESW
jgi:hypothetical protein